MKKNKVGCIAVVLLFAIAAICGIFFVREYYVAQKEKSTYVEIQGSYTSIRTERSGPVLPETAGLPYVAVDFDELLRENSDTVGWLAVYGTDISYPVLQADDNQKYLYTSFNGERSSAGAAFMDANNTAHPLDRNTIIFGHNLGIGREQEMFGPLLQYKELDFFDAHRWIQFDTAKKQYGWWNVFAVIHLDSKAQTFDYLKLNFADREEFAAWIAQAKELSLYETGVTVSPSDKILTLSTCDRSIYGKSGRLLVMAVWVEMEGNT